MTRRVKFMIFFIGTLILVLASVGVLYKTLTGYATLGIFSKLTVLTLLVLSWFAPIWLRFMQKRPDIISGAVYDIAYKLGYFMMGFVLILTMLIIARDILWYVLYFISGKKALFNPDIAHNINVANIVALILALLISFYGVWQAHKTPVVQNIRIQDVRLTSPLKFVIASDFHINHATPKWHIQK